MPKAAPILNSFNAGEFSPLMAGRVDLKYYPHAARSMRNFIPTKQGPARRRPGTRYVAAVKNSANRTWLARFEFNVEQAYVLEFGDFYIRFFANHGVVGAPFEVVTPYSAADLTNTDGTFALKMVQSGDVLYLVHNKYKPRKLSRTGAATFAITALDVEGGPFDDIDPDQTTTVYASAQTGAGITLTASTAIFTAAHVGTLFYLEQKNANNVSQWTQGVAFAALARVRSDGKNYTTVAGGAAGTMKPTHTRGSAQDGAPGVLWVFEDPGYGWAKITAIGGGGLTATADVISPLPFLAVLVGNASTRWAFQSWNDTNGWPDEITFFRERLCFMRTRKVWQSVVSDFENFRSKDDGGIVTDTQAITSDITSDRANKITWTAPSDNALLLGTQGDEIAISELSQNSAYGPGNVKARKQSEYGAKAITALKVGDGIVYVQSSGRKVRHVSYSYEKDGYKSTDLTVMAEHVTKGGVIAQAFQQEPDSIGWFVRNDGALLGVTIDVDQDVRGWHPHRIGGYIDVDQTQFAVVESIITIPAPTLSRNELWMIVKRYINGVTVRYVEYLEGHHEEGDDPQDAFYVDSGLTLDNVKNAILTPGAGATIKGTAGVNFNAPGIFAALDVNKYIHYRYSRQTVVGKVRWFTAIAKITAFVDVNNVTCTIQSAWPSLTPIAANGWRMTATVLSGLGHLIGQTVQVWADGANHPDRVVSALGQIVLQDPASKVHVGLACPAVLAPMALEAGAADGTAQGKTARISRAIIRFHETSGCRYGRSELDQLDRLELRGGSDNMDEAPPLFTGDETVDWPDGYEGQALITIIQDQPGPCTVVAIMPQVNTQDNR